MIAAAVALHVAPALANITGADYDLAKGQAVVTRLERPLCADPLDLQAYFAAVHSGDMALQTEVGACSPLHARHKAVVIKAFPGLNVVRLTVYIGQRAVTGYMTRAALQAP